MAHPLNGPDADFRAKAATDGGYRALLHLLSNGPPRLQRLLPPWTASELDLEALREEVATMSGSERRLLSAALSLFDGTPDLRTLGLHPIALDALACAAEEDLRLVVEGLLLRRGDRSAGRQSQEKHHAAIREAYRRAGQTPPEDVRERPNGPFEALRDQMEEYIQVQKRPLSDQERQVLEANRCPGSLRNSPEEPDTRTPTSARGYNMRRNDADF